MDKLNSKYWLSQKIVSLGISWEEFMDRDLRIALLRTGEKTQLLKAPGEALISTQW